MGSTLIIGIGNELRGDDAAGAVVARRLSERRSDLDVWTVHQLTADMAIGLGRYDTVVFVDADREATEARITSVVPDVRHPQHDPHHMTPGRLLAIAAALDELLPRQALQLGLPACSFAHGDPLSAKAEAAVAFGLSLIEAAVRRTPAAA